jgi:hypothetical protein
MTEIKICPTCGSRLKFSNVHQVGTRMSKRRDCAKCGHVDVVLVQEVFQIIEVARRVKKLPSSYRMRKTAATQTANSRDNERKQRG